MNDKLTDALSEVKEEYIAQAASYKRRCLPRWIGVAAAAVAMVIFLTTLLNPLTLHAKAVSEAHYPKYEWVYREETTKDARSRLRDFFCDSIGNILSEGADRNYTYSPINLYMGLSLAAELTGGDAQILQALNSTDLTSLRAQANEIWNACYLDSGNQTLLASSLWLDKELEYNQSIMDTLATNYYTSVYQGNLGSDSTNKAIATWLDKQTGGMLKDHTKGISLDPDTVLALYSTVYYQAKWRDEFSAARNTSGTFHTPDGDATCTFMNKKEMHAYYYAGENFGAISLSLKDSSQMWLILPDEGLSPKDVLASGAYLDYVFPGGKKPVEGEDFKYMKVNLSLPKFDIQATSDLKPALQELGITNIFDPAADCLTNAVSWDLPTFFTNVNQATRVAIDEKGVTAASYIEFPGAGAAMPPEEIIDFILDRPFLFVITNRYDLPLFAGIVNNP